MIAGATGTGEVVGAFEAAAVTGAAEDGVAWTGVAVEGVDTVAGDIVGAAGNCGVAGAGVYNCHTFFGGGTGLCDNLRYIRDGDEIVIERGDGVKYTYRTVETRDMTVSEANAYMGTLMNVPDGYGIGQSISIITCAGNFDMASQTSDRRFTVRAILER